jgi:hypothetical protein
VWGLTVFTLVSCLALVGCKTDETENPAGWKLGQLPPDLTFGPTVALFYIGNKWISSSFTSTDGKTWTYDINDTTVPRGISGVAYGGTGADAKFVALRSGDKIAYSTDGITWQEVTSSILSGIQGMQNLFYGGDKFFVYSYTGNVYSRDGTTWIKVESGDVAIGSKMAYGNGKWVTDTGAISTNGITWTQGTRPTFQESPNSDVQNATVTNIAYGGGKFVALGTITRQLPGNTNMVWYLED